MQTSAFVLVWILEEKKVYANAHEISDGREWMNEIKNCAEDEYKLVSKILYIVVAISCVN